MGRRRRRNPRGGRSCGKDHDAAQPSGRQEEQDQPVPVLGGQRLSGGDDGVTRRRPRNDRHPQPRLRLPRHDVGARVAGGLEHADREAREVIHEG
jgi:hypothetical protein